MIENGSCPESLVHVMQEMKREVASYKRMNK